MFSTSLKLLSGILVSTIFPTSVKGNKLSGKILAASCTEYLNYFSASGVISWKYIVQVG